MNVLAPSGGKVKDVKSPTNVILILVRMEGRVQSCCLILSVLVRMGIMGNAVKIKNPLVLKTPASMKEDAWKRYLGITSAFADQAFQDRNAQEPETGVYKTHARMLERALSHLAEKDTNAVARLDSKG